MRRVVLGVGLSEFNQLLTTYDQQYPSRYDIGLTSGPQQEPRRKRMNVIEEFEALPISEFKGDYRYLSNFYPCEIWVKGKCWPSSEHLYQAMKSTDGNVQEVIRQFPFKGLKAMGNDITLRPDWDKVKDDLMYRIVKQKFKQNPDIREQLCSTSVDLIEGNYWHDNYWGDCFCKKCIDIQGRNKLGQILMRVRAELSRASGYITSLKDGQIFVFGSNEAGKHGKGAAKLARDKFGAKYGVGSGPTGRCYAIPTKNKYIQTMPKYVIRDYVQDFCKYAREHPELTFLVTEIGCGLAGYKPEDIAPFFRDAALKLPNVMLPSSFRKVIAKINDQCGCGSSKYISHNRIHRPYDHAGWQP